MRISKGRLSSLVTLLIITAFALAGCGSVIGAAARTGGKAVGGLFGENPDKLSPEERAAYVEQKEALRYRGTFDQVSKAIDEAIIAQREALRIRETNLRPSTKWLRFDGVPDSPDRELFALIELRSFSAAEVFMTVRAGEIRSLDYFDPMARRLRVLIDNALKEKRVALVG